MALLGNTPRAATPSASALVPRRRWPRRGAGGLAIGPIGVGLGIAIVLFPDTRVVPSPSPTPAYTPPVPGVARGWGRRVGAAVAAARVGPDRRIGR